jgi:NCS2 family nucleobase:cation symporter-2
MSGSKGDLLYGVDDRPPLGVLGFSAAQHIALMANTLVYPTILAREAGLSESAAIDFVSAAMLALGVGTILHCLRTRYVGSGYLCPAGFTPIFIAPALLALQRGGMGLLFGMTMVSGLVQIAIAPLLRHMRALLPSEIAGLVIAVIGLSVASLGLRNGLGLSREHGIQTDFLVISSVSLFIMLGLNVWTRGYAKSFCVLIGSFTGTVMCIAWGLVDVASKVPSSSLLTLRFPQLDHAFWQFDPVLIAPFAVAAIAGTLHLMGNISTAQRIDNKDWVRPDFRSLSGGLVGNGMATFLAGVVGSFGVNIFSNCIGLTSATGIASRAIGFVIGVALFFLALSPAVAASFTSIPPPVIGASLFFSSAFIFISGLQMITARMLDARKTFVIGFSFAIAMIADSNRELFAQLPVVLQPIFGSPLMIGTTSAIVLNLIMRIGIRQRETTQIQVGPKFRDAVEQFLTEQGGHWAARREVVNRAIFGSVQVIEVIDNSSDPVELEASFDEYNLDIRIRYNGSPLVFPDRPPDLAQIRESEAGERLFAGYLLRRSADRISSRGSDGRAEVHLHYDH